MLTYHQWGSVAFNWGQFYRMCLGYQSLQCVGKIMLVNLVTYPRGQWGNVIASYIVRMMLTLKWHNIPVGIAVTAINALPHKCSNSHPYIFMILNVFVFFSVFQEIHQLAQIRLGDAEEVQLRVSCGLIHHGVRQRSGPTLVQVMACCLTAPSHFLNQCWLIISEVQWHSY